MIALCMIARDEARGIADALESARGLVDEMIVVDTGSTDDTADIARAHGARVVQVRWSDSFADARNVSLWEARADWILVLDADETLDPAAKPLLRACVAEAGGRVRLYQLQVDDDHYVTRFFPRRRALYYHGRIHEELVHERGEAAVERVPLAAAIHHRPSPHRAARQIPLLEKTSQDVLQDGFAQFTLGSHLLERGDPRGALQHLRRSRVLDPGPSEGGRAVPYMAARAVAAAEALRRLGRGDEALDELREASRDFPASPDAAFHLGNLLLDRGLYAEAEDAYRRALERGRSPSWFGLGDPAIGAWKAAMQLGLVLGQRGRWKEALPWLRGACTVAPEVPLARIGLGLCHFHLGACAEALAAWSRVDMEAVAPPDVLAAMAEAQARCGLVEEALDTAWMAALRHPTDPDALLAEARILAEVGDAREALERYRGALARVRDVAAWLEYGELAADLGEAALAERAFHAAAQLDASRPEPLNHLGTMAFQRGDPVAAAELLEAALKADPSYDPAAWNLAHLWILAGHEARALALLRPRLKLGRYRVADMIACWEAWRLEGFEDSPYKHDPVPGIMLAITAAVRTGQGDEAVQWLQALDACGVVSPGLPVREKTRRRRENVSETLMACVRWIHSAPNPLVVVRAEELQAAAGRLQQAARLLGSVLETV